MKIILATVLTFVIGCSQLQASDIFSFSRPNNEINLPVTDGLCPNNKTKCRPTQTCCKTKHNSYHCCRYKNAVCCSDHYHCCPEDSTCDLEKKRCNRNMGTSSLFISEPNQEPMEWKIKESDSGEEQKMLKLAKSFYSPSGLESLDNLDKKSLKSEAMCPNNKTKCKDTKTCCITKHGNYYCCPHKNAVCCSDKWSCCPEGTTCDLKNKKCNNSTNVPNLKSTYLQIAEHEPISEVQTVIESFLGLFSTVDRRCGNTQKKCTGAEKCCAMQNEKFGCCKYRKGVCCPDFATCCPHGTQCDIKNKVCTAKPDDLLPVPSYEIPNAGLCPDNRTDCKEGETCCSVGNVLYGCCPMKDATCCNDKKSCCPKNKKCDLIRNRCVNKDSVDIEKTNEIIKTESLKQESLVAFLNVIGQKKTCPDKSYCYDDRTCCPAPGGRYRCCPYANGTCCPNGRTCCPQGRTCLDGDCI